MCIGNKNHPTTSEDEYAKMRSLVTGDTVVNGRTYNVVKVLFVEGGMRSTELRSAKYLIRVYNDSVYRWDGYRGRDMLECTFDWSPGGKLYYEGTWGESTIGEIKQEEMLDGQFYDYVEDYTKVIRTIGSLWYGLLDCQDFCLHRGFIRLTHFERNGQVIYHHDVEAPPSFRENRNLFPTGTKWREASYTPGSQVRYDDYAIGEETVVGQNTYRRVMKNGEDSGLLIREEGSKVWLLCDEYPEEIKLYDFDWLTFEQPTMEHLRESGNGLELVTDTGIDLDDVSLWYGPGRYQTATFLGRKIYHDVGCVSGAGRNACLLGYKEVETDGSEMTKSIVVHFKRMSEGPMRMAYEYNASIPGEWLTGITSPTDAAAPTPQGLHDLQGRRVTVSPRPGIYIENGRKRVVSGR